MARDERTFMRKLDYSVWHRPKSISRFLGGINADKHRIRLHESESWIEYSDPHKKVIADKVGMVDVDHIVIDGKHFADRGPVALIESAETQATEPDGVNHKAATILTNVGSMARIPTYVVQYHLSSKPNPVYPTYKDIDVFFVQMTWPITSKWIMMAPQRYADFLIGIRMKAGIVAPEQMTLWTGAYHVDQRIQLASD